MITHDQTGDDAPTLDFTDPELTLCSFSCPGSPPCDRPAGNIDAQGLAVCHVHLDPDRREPETCVQTIEDHGSWRVVSVAVPGRPGVTAYGVVRFGALYSGESGAVETELAPVLVAEIAAIRLRRLEADTVLVPETRGRLRCQAITVDPRGGMVSLFWQPITLFFDAPGHETTDPAHEHAHEALDLARLAVQCSAGDRVQLASELLHLGVDPVWLARSLVADIASPDPRRALCRSLRSLGVDLRALLGSLRVRGRLTLAPVLGATSAPRRCTEPECYVHDGESCRAGWSELDECPMYRPAAGQVRQ